MLLVKGIKPMFIINKIKNELLDFYNELSHV